MYKLVIVGLFIIQAVFWGALAFAIVALVLWLLKMAGIS